MNDSLYDYLLLLGDNSMILGHRLSELCGHGPSLETDIALTNISLDLFGQVRSYFQYAAEIKGDGTKEDDIAFLRYENQYRNVILVEQPNKDFAYIIARQFFFDAYHHALLEQLMESKDERIAAIATKSIKEVKYHLRFSSEWMKRLGDGTMESHSKMQEAVTYLYPYTLELLNESSLEKEMKEKGIGADLALVGEAYKKEIDQVLEDATMEYDQELNWSPHNGGKEGRHSEHMGFVLTKLQYMQRAYPNMQW